MKATKYIQKTKYLLPFYPLIGYAFSLHVATVDTAVSVEC